MTVAWTRGRAAAGRAAAPFPWERPLAARACGPLGALALAHHPPGVGGAPLLVSPPLFGGPAEARAATLAALTWAERTFLTDPPWARHLCHAMCMRRPRLARWVATAY